MLFTIIRTLIISLIYVLLISPSISSKLYAKSDLSPGRSIYGKNFLAPKSSYTKEEDKKPKEPFKPLRVRKSDEEKFIIRMHQDIFLINKALYNASLAKGVAVRRRKSIERRIKEGEKGLDKELREVVATEESWSNQIENHLNALRDVQKRFPLPTAADSEQRIQAREFLNRAVVLLEEKNVGAAEALIAGAKKRMHKEIRELRHRHFSSYPRESADELMVKDVRFGEDVRTITYQGFGIRIKPDGTVIVPRQHYLLDSRFDMSYLEFQKDKMKDLPSAERQAVHIQVSEMEDHQRVLGVMKAIVDFKNQIIKSREELNAEQSGAMSRMLVLQILNLNQTGFNGMIKDQADKLELSVKPLLSKMGIKGKNRTEFLKKIRKEFSDMQRELIAPDWSITDPMKDNPMLNPEVRAAKMKEFEEKWNDLLRGELAGLGIALDKEKSREILLQWEESLNNNLQTKIGALITGLDPYGLIKDPFKLHALLHLYMTAELIGAGRIDRNAIEFLDTAKGYLFKRLQNTKRIRNNVLRQAASMRAEARRLADRDDDIRKSLTAIERLVRDDRDINAAKKMVDGIKNRYFKKKPKEPGMQRAERKLQAMSGLLVEMEEQKKRINKAKDKLDDLNKAIIMRGDKLRVLEGTDKKLKAEMLAPNRTKLHLTLARKKLGFLIKHANRGDDEEVASQLKLFLNTLPEGLPVKAKKGRGFLNRLVGLEARINTYLEEDLRQVPSTELIIKLIVGLLDVNKQIDLARQEAGQYMELLNNPDKARELEVELRENRQAIEEENSTLKQMAMQLSRVKEETEKETKEAQDAFDAIAQKKIYDNINSIREDLVYKYEDVVPPSARRPAAHAFFDSKRLDALKGRLKGQGVSDAAIDKLLALLEEVKAPAVYEAGQIYTENFLMGLDKKVSEFSGDKTRSFFQTAREIIYHEMAHEYLSKEEGLEMIRTKVLTYPRFAELEKEMRQRYPGMKDVEMSPEDVAQEAVAKMVSTVFEGRLTKKQAEKDSFDNELFMLKEHIRREPTYEVLTADGIEAAGDEKKEKRVFYMLKTVLGKKEEKLTSRSRDELDEEARSRLSDIEEKAEVILGEIEKEKEKTAELRKGALEFIAKHKDVFRDYVHSKKLVEISGEMLEDPEKIFKGMEGREFVLGADEKVVLSEDIINGLRDINSLNELHIKKLTKMKPRDWKTFLYGLFIRSKMDFKCDIKEKLPVSPDSEHSRMNAVASMMARYPLVADALDLEPDDERIFTTSLRKLIPEEMKAQEDEPGGKQLSDLMYEVDWTPFLPEGFRSPPFDLRADLLVKGVPRLIGFPEEHKESLRHRLVHFIKLPEIVKGSLEILRDKTKSEEKRLRAIHVLSDHAPQDHIEYIVDETVLDPSSEVRKLLIQAIFSTVWTRRKIPSDEIMDHYGRLHELARKEEDWHVIERLLAITKLLENDHSRDILIAFLSNPNRTLKVRGGRFTENPMTRLRENVIERLAVYPSRETVDTLVEILATEKDPGSIYQANKVLTGMFADLDERLIILILGAENLSNGIMWSIKFNDSDEVRKRSVDAISKTFPDLDKEKLKVLLRKIDRKTWKKGEEDVFFDVRMQAVSRMRDFMDDEVEEMVDVLLKISEFDSSKEIRRKADEVIAGVLPELEMEELITLMGHENPAMKRKVIEQIKSGIEKNVARVEVISAKIAEGSEDEEELNEKLEEVRIETGAAVSALVEAAIDDPGTRVRDEATYALFNILDKVDAGIIPTYAKADMLFFTDLSASAREKLVFSEWSVESSHELVYLMEKLPFIEDEETRNALIYVIAHFYPELTISRENVEDIPAAYRMNLLMEEGLPEGLRAQMTFSKWRFAGESDFIEFVRWIPYVKDSGFKGALLVVAGQVAPSFYGSERVQEELRGLSVLLDDPDTDLRVPLAMILAEVGDEGTLDALEEAMKDGKEIDALKEAALKIEFPMAVKGLTSRATSQISDKDLERISEIAASLKPEQVSPAVFTQLGVMLKRLIKTHPEKIKGLIDIAFIRRFGVSEKLAVDALTQRSLPPNMHIVNEYGKLADGKAVQRYFDYDMKTDTVKHRRNEETVLRRIPGTTVFGVAPEEAKPGSRLKTMNNGISSALAVDDAA